MEMEDIISATASLDNMRQNMDMKRLAKEVLLEKNYVKFMKSYKFTFWFQLLGVLSGFLLPSVVIIILTKEISYFAVGAVIGIPWMCLWLPISLLMPQTKIYRKFAKWFRKKNATAYNPYLVFKVRNYSNLVAKVNALCIQKRQSVSFTLK